MAAEWHYVVNQKQSGPVELSVLQQMREAGTLSSGDLVFGPGLTEWTPAGRVTELSPYGEQAPMASLSTGMGMTGASAAPGMLGYRGTDTGGAGISPQAIELLRQTKPWARFVSVIIFIVSGLMLIIALIIAVTGAFIGGRVPAGLASMLGLMYFAFAALYVAPAIFLNRYASGIAALLRTNRASDLEAALKAQKSFWKFIGIMMLVILCIYAVIILVAMIAGIMR